MARATIRKLAGKNGTDRSETTIERVATHDLRLMSASRFRQVIVGTVDQHAAVIADLSQQLQVTREFLADLSSRLDQLVLRITQAQGSTEQLHEVTARYLEARTRDLTDPPSPDPSTKES